MSRAPPAPSPARRCRPSTPTASPLQQFSEAAGGQVVFHLHMHVMPRHNGIALLPPASRKEDAKVLEDNATKLIAALKSA